MRGNTWTNATRWTVGVRDTTRNNRPTVAGRIEQSGVMFAAYDAGGGWLGSYRSRDTARNAVVRRWRQLAGAAQ